MKYGKTMSISIATQTEENMLFLQPVQGESFKAKTLDLLESKPRMLGKWGAAAISVGQLTKILPGQSAAIEVARNFFNAANWGLAPKDLVISANQFSEEIREGKGRSALSKGALKIAKVVKDLFKAVAAFGVPVLKALTLPVEGFCALGSAFYASTKLWETKIEKSDIRNPKKFLETLSSAIDVAGGGMFLSFLLTGRAISPVISATMGLTSLTSAVALHYLESK